MMSENGFALYAGTGNTLAARNLRLPPFEAAQELTDPQLYLAESGLRDAVNVALTLGQPLLLTGEPGTGKTQLAYSVAHELNLPPPLVFNTKTTSTARDLFYRYNALGHFHDAHLRSTAKSAALDVEKYIAYEALGLAILLAQEPKTVDKYLPEALRGQGPTRSVVLLDEVDKAPRDLPNDVLNEMENMAFQVRETGRAFVAPAAFRPIVILTSNSEKNLPDAFLRRCIYYHIHFPNRARLKEIVQRRLVSEQFSPEMLDAALHHFEEIRKLELRKKPATAELLSWLRALKRLGAGPVTSGPQPDEIISTYAALAKNQQDLETIARQMHRG
jgi:MoxR-like ATPase